MHDSRQVCEVKAMEVQDMHNSGGSARHRARWDSPPDSDCAEGPPATGGKLRPRATVQGT
jgi:hypothetical protein